MEYIKGKPYFCYCQNKIKQYPYLNKNLTCEILIIGGGIDGAIANYYLSKNYDVALVDKGRFGCACTACATALLEYQLDDFASELKKYMTDEEIVMCYNLGLKATQKIENFLTEHGNHCQFTKRPTFLYTNSTFSQKDIEEEYHFRISNGFNCQLLTHENNPFPFEIKAGILAQNGGSEFNPYLFAKQMIEGSCNQQNIFENTHITKLQRVGENLVATTAFGENITCKKIILATGFNWEVLTEQDLCERFVTYSIVTSPVENFSWHQKALIHDATSPYHYLRLLPDKRIIFGGEDTPFKTPISEKKTNKIYDKLQKDLFKLFPEIADSATIDYKFCGAFGTTLNNMGLIGKSSFDDDILLFISCGANGIANAMVGVEVIQDLLKNKQNPLSSVFSPKRENIF